MNPSNLGPHLSIALLHYPVKNRLGETICSQVDNLDFFDASRLSLTYDLARLFMINPIPAQRDIVHRLIKHSSDPSREADERGVFNRSVWVPNLDAAIDAATDHHGTRPKVVVTTAVPAKDSLGFDELRGSLGPKQPALVLFGKAWGFAEPVFEYADARLAAIDEGTGYNHLSVRSALAIIIDRLVGAR